MDSIEDKLREGFFSLQAAIAFPNDLGAVLIVSISATLKPLGGNV